MSFIGMSIKATVSLWITPSPVCVSLPQGQARIQDSEGGGVRTFKRGGVRTFKRGGFVQEFQERIQIVAGPCPWANQQAKQIADNRRGGGSDHPPKKPVSAPEGHVVFPSHLRVFFIIIPFPR